jgi:hypothetical protein
MDVCFSASLTCGVFAVSGSEACGKQAGGLQRPRHHRPPTTSAAQRTRQHPCRAPPVASPSAAVAKRRKRTMTTTRQKQSARRRRRRMRNPHRPFAPVCATFVSLRAMYLSVTPCPSRRPWCRLVQQALRLSSNHKQKAPSERTPRGRGEGERANGRRGLEATDTNTWASVPCPLCARCPSLRGASVWAGRCGRGSMAAQNKKKGAQGGAGRTHGDRTGTRRQERSAVTRRVRAAGVSAVPRGLCALPPSALLAAAPHSGKPRQDGAPMGRRNGAETAHTRGADSVSQ